MDKNFEATKTFEFVNDFFGFDISIKSRKRSIVEARMMYAKLMKVYTNTSLTEIGLLINKDHATIIHYLKNFRHIKKQDREFSNKYDILSEVYEDFRKSWFDLERFDDKKRIQVLESSLKSALDKKELYENYIKKIKRIDSIVQLIEERTPRGEEEYVESKINRMFNSIIFNP